MILNSGNNTVREFMRLSLFFCSTNNITVLKPINLFIIVIPSSIHRCEYFIYPLLFFTQNNCVNINIIDHSNHQRKGDQDSSVMASTKKRHFYKFNYNLYTIYGH